MKYAVQIDDIDYDSNENCMQDGVEVITIDQAYELSYGNNFFQLFNMIFIRFSYCLTGYLSFSLPFLVKTPNFLCRNTKDEDWIYCTKHEACSGKYFDYKIDYESKETVVNWITLGGLECAPNYQIGMFGSLFFVAFFLDSAIFLRLADIMGRKLFVLIGAIGSLVCTVIIYFINDFITLYIMLFITSIFLALRMFIGYIYSMELTPPESKKSWHMFMQLIDKIHAILIPIFIYYTGNAKYPLIFIILTTVPCIYFVYKAPESPKYLYSYNKWDELHEAFEYISSRNCTRWSDYKFDTQSNSINTNTEKQNNCMDNLKDKCTFKNLLIMIFLWSTCCFCDYTLVFYCQYFKGSMYVNAAIIGLGDVLSKFIIRILQSYQETKTTYAMIFLIVFVISCVYYIISDIAVCVIFSIFFLKCGIACNFGLSFYANQEYFQTNFTSTSFAACNTVARFCTIFAPMFAEVLPQPLILVSCATFIASILPCFLTKPTEKPLSDMPNNKDLAARFERAQNKFSADIIEDK